MVAADVFRPRGSKISDTIEVTRKILYAYSAMSPDVTTQGNMPEKRLHDAQPKGEVRLWRRVRPAGIHGAPACFARPGLAGDAGRRGNASVMPAACWNVAAWSAARRQFVHWFSERAAAVDQDLLVAADEDGLGAEAREGDSAF